MNRCPWEERSDRQDRQFVYNETLSRVRGTIVAVEKQYCILWVGVCSLTYTACNAHAPYCRLWSLRLCSIFPHYLIRGTIFDTRVLSIKCVFDFLCNFETFLILRRIERDMIKKNCIALHVKCPLLLLNFNETLIFAVNFWRKKNYSNIKFHENSFSGSRVIACGRTDTQTGLTKLIIAFRNFANASNKPSLGYVTGGNQWYFKGTTTRAAVDEHYLWRGKLRNFIWVLRFHGACYYNASILSLSSSTGTTARCGLWPVEQDPSILFLSVTNSLHHR
jgi:hypothetical protein